jgi:hypothetical protein
MDEETKRLAEVMAKTFQDAMRQVSFARKIFHKTYRFEGELHVWDRELGWNITNLKQRW